MVSEFSFYPDKNIGLVLFVLDCWVEFDLRWSFEPNIEFNNYMLLSGIIEAGSAEFLDSCVGPCCSGVPDLFIEVNSCLR